MKVKTTIFKGCAVFFGLLNAFVIVLMVESLSLYTLRIIGSKPQPFFLAETHTSLAPTYEWDDTGRSLTYIDPLLAFSHDPAIFKGKPYIPGFLILSEPTKKPSATLRIFTLGGSTTAPSRFDWPSELQQLLRKNKVQATVFNGGVPGYSSNEELLKLIRDVIPLQPDIVISLNGTNDLGFLHAIPRHPLVHRYHQEICEHVANLSPATFLPNTVKLIKTFFTKDRWRINGINYGPEVSTKPVSHWRNNVRIMSAIGKTFNFHYICFLQPVMGFGQFIPSDHEKRMKEELKNRKKYLNDLTEFYIEAEQSAVNESDCVNLTGIFADKSDVYRDQRHQNHYGVRLIAEAIFAELDRRKWLQMPVESK